MTAAVSCVGFAGSPFRRLPSEVLHAVCGFLVGRDALTAEEDDADWVCKSFHGAMTLQRWSQRPASVKVAALSNKVQLLAKWMGRRVTELVVTVDSGSISTDMQQFLRNLLDGRDLRDVLPRLARLHLRTETGDGRDGSGEGVSEEEDESQEEGVGQQVQAQAQAPVRYERYSLEGLGAVPADLKLVLEQFPVPDALPEGIRAIEMQQCGDPVESLHFAHLKHLPLIEILLMRGLEVKSGGKIKSFPSGLRAEHLQHLPPTLVRLELGHHFSDFVASESTPWPASLRELKLDGVTWSSPGFPSPESAISLCKGLQMLEIHEHRDSQGEFHVTGLPASVERLELHMRRTRWIGAYPPLLKMLLLDVTPEGFESTEPQTPTEPEDVAAAAAEYRASVLSQLVGGEGEIAKRLEFGRRMIEAARDQDVASMWAISVRSSMPWTYTPTVLDLGSLPVSLSTLVLKLNSWGLRDTTIGQLLDLQGSVAKQSALCEVRVELSADSKVKDSKRQSIADFVQRRLPEHGVDTTVTQRAE